MDGTSPARITGIFRYPVKGLTPEQLSRTELSPGQTLLADRRYAILLPPDQVDLTYAAGTGSRVVYAVAGTGYLHEWLPQRDGGSALPVSWVPEAGRMGFLSEMLKHRDVTLSLIYEEWKRTRTKM